MNRSSKIALIVVIVAILWLFTGIFKSNTPHKENLNDEKKPQKMTVRVKQLTASPKINALILRGATAPNRTVILQAETQGRVLWLTPQKGAFMAKDTPIVGLDPDERKARLSEAEAAFNGLKINYEAAQNLFKKGFSSKASLMDAKSKAEGAEAVFKRAGVELGRTEIKAPFDGVLQDTFVEVGAYVSPNSPSGSKVATFIELDPLVTTVYVTENDLPKFKHGSEATIKRSDGKVLKGQITYIAGAADPQTKTFKVELKSPNPEHLPAGMTAEITVPYETTLAHLVSPALLTLATDGVIGAKYVDAQNIARFVPITIIDTTEKGIWITGLPQTVNLITVGGEFVRAGEEIVPQREEDAEKPSEKAPQ